MNDLTQIDPFALFRGTLFLALAAFTVVTTAGTLIRVIRELRGDDPRKRLLRAYLGYAIASARIRPLLSELYQLAAWTALLLLIWWAHTLI